MFNFSGSPAIQSILRLNDRQLYWPIILHLTILSKTPTNKITDYKLISMNYSAEEVDLENCRQTICKEDLEVLAWTWEHDLRQIPEQKVAVLVQEANHLVGHLDWSSQIHAGNHHHHDRHHHHHHHHHHQHHNHHHCWCSPFQRSGRAWKHPWAGSCPTCFSLSTCIQSDRAGRNCAPVCPGKSCRTLLPAWGILRPAWPVCPCWSVMGGIGVEPIVKNVGGVSHWKCKWVVCLLSFVANICCRLKSCRYGHHHHHHNYYYYYITIVIVIITVIIIVINILWLLLLMLLLSSNSHGNHGILIL